MEVLQLTTAIVALLGALIGAMATLFLRPTIKLKRWPMWSMIIMLVAIGAAGVAIWGLK